MREATRIGWAPPAVALCAVIAHSNDSLEALPKRVTQRQVDVHSVSALAIQAAA